MAAASGGGSKWRDPGDLPAPEHPGSLDIFKDNTYMLMVKDRDSDLLKRARPRDVYKTISEVIPNILHCKRLESGNFLIKIDKSQKESTLSITKIGEIPVKIEEPGAMNYTKVTIKHKDIPKYTNEELTEDLKKENSDVVSAEIQTSWVDKIEKKSEFAVVTLDGKFSEQQLKTKKLIYWWEKLHLKLHIPPPNRCKNCWAFDHFTSKKRPCTQKGICGFCGDQAHVDSQGNKITGKCTKQRRCINCQKGDHPAWSKECVRYREEQKIMEKATQERISVKQARFLLERQTEKKKESFASVVSDTKNPFTKEAAADNRRANNHNNDVIQMLTRLEQLMTLVAHSLNKLTKKTNDNDISDEISDSENYQDYDTINSTSKHSTSKQESNIDIDDSDFTSSLSKLQENCLDYTRLRNTFQDREEVENMDDGGEERKSVKRRGSGFRISGGEPGAKRVVTDVQSRGAGNPPASYTTNRGSRRSSASSSRSKDLHKPVT